MVNGLQKLKNSLNVSEKINVFSQKGFKISKISKYDMV